jgi:4-amino-4-deoxy-L-arabinose transferase-like glycosyltransferase
MRKFVLGTCICILIVGALTRLGGLGQLPLVLNRDEAALAVTARFIGATGADEHDHRWPLNTKSFGDWKLASYSYILLPFLTLFGNHDWVVRLPSALIGIAMIGGVWLLIWELTYSETSLKKPSFLIDNRYLLATCSAFLLAFSPWSLHVSRIAYEGHIAAGFAMASVWFFLRSLRPHSALPWYLVLATSSALLSMITYHAFQVVMPLLGLSLLSLYWRQLWAQREQFTMPISISVSIVIIVFGVFVLDGLAGANIQKFAGISIFSSKNYETAIIAKWGSLPIYWGRKANLYSNYFFELGMQVVKNAFALVDLRFLFLNGGSEPIHRFAGAGLFHLFELITLSVGLFIAIKQRAKWHLTLLLWLGVALVPALITLQPQHPIRLLGALVPLTCISALGMVTLLEAISSLPRQSWKYLATTCAVGSIFVSISFTLLTYFYYFAKQQYSNWPWYMPAVVRVGELALTTPEIKHIVFQGTSLSPYVFYLWYGTYDFSTIAQSIKYYQPDESGFEHVEQLGQIKFEQVDWPAIEARNEHSLFIVRKSELPPDKLSDHRYDIQQEISQPESEVSYVVVVFKP